MEKQVNTEQDYIKLHQMVLDYQNNKGNANEILNSFNNFIWLFVNVICSNNMAMKLKLIKVKSVRKFVSMFMYDKENKKHVDQAKKKNKVTNNICEALNVIHDLFSQYTEDDIRNTLINALLLMATKYKDKRPSFHNYVDKCFYYYAYYEMQSLFKDPIGKNNHLEFDLKIQDLNDYGHNNKFFNKALNKYNTDIENVNDKIDIEYKLKKSNTLTLKENPSQYSDSFFNINWVNGVTCSELFSGIPPLHREILVMYYVHNLTDEQISKRLDICRVNVNKKRNEAKKLLESKLKGS